MILKFVFLWRYGKRIKWFKIEINKKRLDKLKRFSTKNFFKKINRKKLIKNKKTVLEILSTISIDKLELDSEFGLNNIVLLSFLVTLINIIISIFLAKNAHEINEDNYKYNIIPTKTENSFYLKLSINCIISLKIVNIINIILKKRGNLSARTSNRIINGNCYE